ncbi:NAD(P)-binding domain-containing protein [Actinomadura sp. NPDC000600]|uniref:flavin-containing monooxygenase n=1 Tax=Actinomadura sp. NPDC000600 TaxID=3154262 RepID=UPI003394B786
MYSHGKGRTDTDLIDIGHIDTVVIGAGHAGLAMSRHLADRGVDHVVVERGRIAERWRSARWDSCRLLTPNRLTRLPGRAYQGADPDGFMTAAGLASYLEDYARSFAAPVVESTAVTEVRQLPGGDGGYVVRTDRGSWTAANLVIATGYHAHAQVPGCAAGLPPDLVQVTAAGYRSPAHLPEGGVLVVGASASGVQIADELRRAGRQITLAVGAHSRLPRRYRGRDIFWWLERTGSLDRVIDDLPDPARALREPSLQLSGSDRAVDLGALRDRGVRVAGRLAAVEGGAVRFADDLGATTAAAEARLRRVLAGIDDHVAGSPVPDAEPVPPVLLESGPRTLDLRRAAVSTVVWATGMRPRYPWLKVPVLDGTGRIRHRRGVTAAPGLYAIGLRFQYRRDSTFIGGARHDAAYLADHIAVRRAARPRRTPH